MIPKCGKLINKLSKKFIQEDRSSYSLGQGLFGAGKLAKIPTDPLKQEIWKKLSLNQ